MPSQNLTRIHKNGIYIHVYNKGINHRTIFADQEDYETFLKYLEEYVSPPKDAASTKTVFQVNGRTFKGIPHQPKNYFKQVELIAYRLSPNHYHLVLHQLQENAVEKLLRSLCTRYVIYFNKKYERTGTLFEGPYKSVGVSEGPELSYLSSYLHQNTTYSSYEAYVHPQDTSQVTTTRILAFFDNNAHKYQAFVSTFANDTQGHDLIKHIIIDKDTLENDVAPIEQPVAQFTTQSIPQATAPSATPIFVQPRTHPPPATRLTFFITSIGLYIVLSSFGINNVNVIAQRNQALAAANNSHVLSETTTNTEIAEPTVVAEPTQPEESKTISTVRIVKGATHITIHKEPSLESPTIGSANSGDTFELISGVAGWYEVRLPTGEIGYIVDQFVVLE